MNYDDIMFLRNGVRKLLLQPRVRRDMRPKQAAALNALISPEFSDEQIAHSYFKLPTGFGKTVMFSRMARAYFDAAGRKRQKILIVVPRLLLIDQTREKLERFAGITASEFSGKEKNITGDVIITTYQSLTKLFGVVDFNDIGLIFADEAHHILGDKISKQLEFYNKFVPIIGFTATPEYEANRTVANMLDTQVYNMTIQDCVLDGILSPVKNVLYRSSIVCDLATVPAKNNGDYDYDNITAKINPDTLVGEIARIYADGRDANTGIEFRDLKAIINCPNINIAKIQAAKINQIMGRDVAAAIHTEMNDNQFKQLKNDFVSGKYSVVCQVGTLTEGFDDPSVAMCINYPTRSRVKAEQAAGRAIRIDKNNPAKVAFVVDTIFRATPSDRDEDILQTASTAHQVLFQHIAGTSVLAPEKFHIVSGRGGVTPNLGPRTGETMFDGFALTTDTATLMELERRENERRANEYVGPKTDMWQTATDLALDTTFPIGDKGIGIISIKMAELQSEMPEFIQPRKPKSGPATLCLHRDGREMFIEKAGIVAVLPKTKEWQSVTDLYDDTTFPITNRKLIAEKLTELQSEMPEFIQTRKPTKGPATLCLHKNGRDRFLKLVNYDYVPSKTNEWQAASELLLDKTFPISTGQLYTQISTLMDKLQSENPEYIQRRRSQNGTVRLCLRRDARDWFLKKLGYDCVPAKTDEWQSVKELLDDESFPISGYRLSKNVSEKLVELQSKIPEYIQYRKPTKGANRLCLHKNGREMFLKMGWPEMFKAAEFTSGTQTVSAANEMIDTTRTISTTTKNTKLKKK